MQGHREHRALGLGQPSAAIAQTFPDAKGHIEHDIPDLDHAVRIAPLRREAGPRRPGLSCTADPTGNRSGSGCAPRAWCGLHSASPPPHGQGARRHGGRRARRPRWRRCHRRPRRPQDRPHPSARPIRSACPPDGGTATPGTAQAGIGGGTPSSVRKSVPMWSSGCCPACTNHWTQSTANSRVNATDLMNWGRAPTTVRMRGKGSRSEELMVCKAKVAHPGDDDVIENRQVQGPSRFHQGPRVRRLSDSLGRGFPRGMVVDQDEGGGPHHQGLAKRPPSGRRRCRTAHQWTSGGRRVLHWPG